MFHGLLFLAQLQSLVPVDRRESFAERVWQICPVADPRDYNRLIRRQDQLADSAASKHPAPDIWRSLGCTRALLAAMGALAHEGTLMPVATSWARGTINVLMKALDSNPGDARSTELLAVFVLSRPVPQFGVTSTLMEEFAIRLHRAVRAGVEAPAVFRACHTLLVAIGDFASARDCSSRAMQAGSDSTWHWLHLARVSFAERDPIDGLRLFQRAAMSAHGAQALNELLYPFLVDADLPRWSALSDAERWHWIQDSLSSPPISEPDSFRSMVGMRLRQMPSGDGQYSIWSCSPFSVACDRFLPRGETLLHTAARFHQLWDPGTGQPVAMISFGVRVGDLPVERSGASRVADIAIEIHTWDAAATRWADTTILQHLKFPAAASADAFATGRVIIPSSPGITSWSIAVRQSEKRRGRTHDDRRVPLETGPLAVSDVVLGNERRGMEWTYGGSTMFIAPLGGVMRNEPLKLFYQVQSDRDRAQLKAAFFVRPAGGGDPTELPSSPDARVSKGINELTTVLDLSQLEPGDYRLEVVLTDAADGRSVRRSITLSIN